MSASDSTDLGPALDLPADRDGAPSGVRLWELILAERDALVAARRADGSGSTRASSHLAILQMLVERARGEGVTSVGAASPIERLRAQADVFRTEGVARRSKSMRRLRAGLAPFNVELLRPQAEFNLGLVDVLRQLQGAAPTGDGQWVRQRLGRLAIPTAWTVKSHRKNLSGRIVELTKSSYLKAVGPLVGPILQVQAEWNEAVIELLVARAGAPRAEGEAAELLARVRSLQDPVANGGATAFLWHEVMQRQVGFNTSVTAWLDGGPASSSTIALPYPEWISRREARRAEALRATPSEQMITVVVLATGADEAALADSLASLQAQTHPRWHAVVVTAGGGGALPEALTRDSRIAPRTVNPAGIGGSPWLAFVEAGDRLSPLALAEFLASRWSEEADLVYSDEDVAGPTRTAPFFKPDYSYELLTSCDYASHLLFCRRELFEQLGGLPAAGPARLYGLVLRAAERSARIRHLPEVLYSRAPITAPRQAAFVPAGGKEALEAHLKRSGVAAAVRATPAAFHVEYPVGTQPLVSIIVPFRDKPELLRTLVSTLLAVTRYQRFELLLVDNQSQERATAQLLASFSDPRIRVLSWDHPFSYTAINNFGAREAKGELLLFLNNDIEVIEPGWLDLLVGHALQPGVGAVAPKLVFPDRSIQHAGVVIGMGGFAGHVFAGQPDDGRWTLSGSADWTRNTLALTSAATLMPRGLFRKLGGFDERFRVCGADVDLCLRAHEQGHRIVYQAAARLVHHESATRRSDAIPAGDFWESFRSYAPWFDRDPGYSQHLALTDTQPRLREESAPPALDVALAHLAGQERLGSGHRLSGGRLSWVRWGQDMVRKLDLTPAQLAAARRPSATREPPRKLTWFVPYFDHAFGGVHTLLRFADTWRKRFGVENRFVVFDYPHVTPREMEARVAMLFDPLPGQFEVLKSIDDLETLGASDVSIATLWSSAYYVVRHSNAKARAYFVQDDEPHFYPAGTFSGLAEGSYGLGLFGIFNSRGLHDYVTSHYEMKGTFFEPSVDHGLFHPEGRSAQKPVRVFFYGRPSVDRNAFELGLEALRLLKAKLGNAVSCISAGEAWEPSWFGVEGIVENLGVLPYRETAALYRTVDVGLCMMFTKHPSYLPLELMASGVTVVSNDNPANAWLFEHGTNCLLAEPTASAISAQLATACGDEALRGRVGRAAVKRLHATQWEAEAEKTWHALVAHCTVSR